MEGFARKLGLDIELARDARQDTMAAFAEALRARRFDRARGRLRDFLFRIARNKIIDIKRREGRRRARHALQPDETSFFEHAQGENQLAELWEAEWQTAVRAQCLTEAQANFSDGALPRILSASDRGPFVRRRGRAHREDGQFR